MEEMDDAFFHLSLVDSEKIIFISVGDSVSCVLIQLAKSWKELDEMFPMVEIVETEVHYDRDRDVNRWWVFIIGTDIFHNGPN